MGAVEGFRAATTLGDGLTSPWCKSETDRKGLSYRLS